MENQNWSRLERATRIRKIRKYTKLSQEQFAEKIGMNYEAYKKVEWGTNNITVDNLTKLREYIGVSADYILFGETRSFEDTWFRIDNCNEADKLQLMLRLFKHFCFEENAMFYTNDLVISELLEKILALFEEERGV